MQFLFITVQLFLALTGGVPFWVGLQRDSDRWFWTDGTDSASLPWKSKEFSNCCENDEVTVIYNQGLQVVTVEDWQTGFVCKIDGNFYFFVSNIVKKKNFFFENF